MAVYMLLANSAVTPSVYQPAAHIESAISINRKPKQWRSNMSDIGMERELTLSSGIAAFEAKHFVKASQLLAPLADEGHQEAQFRLAVMCQNGLGMVANPEKAAAYMRAAAEQGHALAQHGLGFMYLHGECLAQDAAEAARWFRLAADQGLPGSLATLAEMYQNGNGVPRDEEEARRLYEQAGFSPEELR